MLVAGVDCGLDGAIAIYNSETRVIEGMRDMPTFDVMRGQKKRRDLDLPLIYAYFKAHPKPDHVFVEAAQAMPKQSSYSTGIFFQCYGSVLGILTALEIPFTAVHPATWKRPLSVPALKDAARGRASQLIPSGANFWPLKKHDGRAEAALIAYWGALKEVAGPRRRRA